MFRKLKSGGVAQQFLPLGRDSDCISVETAGKFQAFAVYIHICMSRICMHIFVDCLFMFIYVYEYMYVYVHAKYLYTHDILTFVKLCV